MNWKKNNGVGALVLAFTIAVMAVPSFAGVLYETGFETSEGYDVTDKYLAGQPSEGDSWSVVDSNRFLARDNKTFNGSTGSARAGAFSFSGAEYRCSAYVRVARWVYRG